MIIGRVQRYLVSKVRAASEIYTTVELTHRGKLPVGVQTMLTLIKTAMVSSLTNFSSHNWLD